MSEARWVAARSRAGWVEHAVWVTHNTPPPQPGQELPTRPGISICGVKTPRVIAGANGGHDWDRVDSLRRCTRCVRRLHAAANATTRP